LCKQWGQKHNTSVIVDHINLVDLPAKAAQLTPNRGPTPQLTQLHDDFVFMKTASSAFLAALTACSSVSVQKALIRSLVF